MPAWLSDALSQLATGGGFATRTNYTDTEETYLDAVRPITLNGITDFLTRGDMVDRCVYIHLLLIPEELRRCEKEFWQAFRQVAPQLVGALLNAVAGGLAHLGEVEAEAPALPRMADFALWGEAVCRGLGYDANEFLEAYRQNRQSATVSLLEDSRIGGAVQRFMENRQSWEGTATELLDELSVLVGEATAQSKSWPKTPHALSGYLKRLAPSLRTVGIDVQFGRDLSPSRRRLITITRAEPARVTQKASRASRASTGCATD
jgi:hypothetical protein